MHALDRIAVHVLGRVGYYVELVRIASLVILELKASAYDLVDALLLVQCWLWGECLIEDVEHRGLTEPTESLMNVPVG